MLPFEEANNLFIKHENQSYSLAHFGVILMQNFFTHAELTNENTNVLGRAAKGKNKQQMIPLDEKRLSYIQNNIYNSVDGSAETKLSVWKTVMRAMNKKIASLKSTKN